MINTLLEYYEGKQFGQDRHDEANLSKKMYGSWIFKHLSVSKYCNLFDNGSSNLCY